MKTISLLLFTIAISLVSSAQAQTDSKSNIKTCERVSELAGYIKSKQRTYSIEYFVKMTEDNGLREVMKAIYSSWGPYTDPSQLNKLIYETCIKGS
jgi:hypothetical protein